MTLPTDSTARKAFAMVRGCLNYFPAALAGVARWSKLGNDKHNPGEEMHHARGKSSDHADCIVRHLMDLEALLRLNGPDGDELGRAIMDECDALSWRALALSQELHERFGGAQLAPGARLPVPAGTLDDLDVGACNCDGWAAALDAGESVPPCSIHGAALRAMPLRPPFQRCSWERRGERCDLPAGHSGSHKF